MSWGDLTVSDQATVAVGFVAMALAWPLAVAVYRVRKDSRLNRLVAGVLAMEGLLAGCLSAITLLNLEADFEALTLLGVFLVADATAMLLFVGGLHPAWARRLGARAGVATLAAFGVGLIAASAWAASARREDGLFTSSDPSWSVAWSYLGLAALVAFVATLHDFRLTREGSAARRQGRAFALAFGVRNGLLFLGIFAWAASDALGLLALREWAEVTGVVGMALLPALLAYGVLSTQLFDIELKMKLGIKSGTLAAILVGGFFAGYKVFEFYLGREFGYVFGGVLSGLFFFLAPRLNKFADGVANKAIPQAQPTPDYIAYKKLEVYKAAVESAWEDGLLDARDRSLLDSLRRKLALKQADADAIEAEFAGTRPAPPVADAAPA